MRELIVSFTQKLNTEFNGKTVGAGGDFGSTLTAGPFPINTYFHQWKLIDNPSIHVQVIQEAPTVPGIECCGGETSLLLNIRISVNQEGQGWSIAMALYEALRNWLCETNYKFAPDGETYLVIASQQQIADHVYEGDIFSIHTRVTLNYSRRFES